MKRIVTLLGLLVSCVNLQYPCEKTFQVDYIENGEIKCIFLNVTEVEEEVYKVNSQEFMNDTLDVTIIEFFVY